MIITIDGPAGSGKSTIAKKVAEALMVEYFETGAMYRAFTYFVLEHKVNPDNDKAIKKLLKKFSFDIFTDHSGKKHYFIKAEEVTDKIRGHETDNLVSKISAKGFVRKRLVKIQRAFARKTAAVFEGRDMGSVVFPKADYKFFLTADLKVRALRRYEEIIKKRGDQEEQIKLEDVLEDLHKRDAYDSKRKISPLICPRGAIVVDTSHMSIDGVVAHILGKIGVKEHKTGWLYRFCIVILRRIFKLLYKLEVHGLEHVKKGGMIIASNHVSFFDPIVVAISCPEEVHFLARKSLFNNYFFRKLIEALNTHPINRGVLDKKTLQQVGRLMQEGKKILIFPEGTRSKSGEIEKLKDGIGYMASYAKCDILPVYIHGVYEIWSRKRLLPKFRGKIICTFANAISGEGLTRKEITHEVEKSLKDLAAKMSRTSTGNPD